SPPRLRQPQGYPHRVHRRAAGDRPPLIEPPLRGADVHYHSPPESIFAERIPAGLGGRWYGVFPAIVSDVSDPDGQGRLKVTLPWSSAPGGSRYEAWARLATLMGGKNRGSWFVPDVNDEVLVAFEGGEPRRPYILGGLWNGSDSPPESMDGGGKND